MQQVRTYHSLPAAQWCILLLSLGMAAVLVSCSDSGAEPGAGLTVDRVIPDSGRAGDTVIVIGSGFGETQFGGSVRFAGVTVVNYLAWSATAINVLVPTGAVTGSVVVTVDGVSATGPQFRVTSPGGGSGISFAGQVQPILNMGCALSGCHRPPAPTSGFDQSAYNTLRLGGVKFGSAVIIPGDSANSMIIRAMRGTAPGLARMPFGGPWVASGVPDSLIVTIGSWIEEGAANN